MKKLVCPLALGAALILPAQTGAKNLTKVTVCGVNDCNTLTGPRLRNFPDGGDPDGSIAAPAPYYRIRFTLDADGREHQWTAYFIPSADRLAAPDERVGLAWLPLDDPAMDDATAGLKPYPKPDVTEVTIGSKHVRTNPESYFRLYTVESDGEAVAGALGEWAPITFHSSRKTPWTMSESGLYYLAGDGLIQRGIEIVKLPADMAASVRAGAPLPDESSFPWQNLILALIGLAALVAAAGAFPLRRHLLLRRQPTPA